VIYIKYREGDILKTRIGIIFGGNSVEHEISILSSIQVNYAIDASKYDVYNIYMTKDGRFWVGEELADLETFKKDHFKHYEVTFYSKKSRGYLKGVKRLPMKYKKSIDVILPIVHGKNTEDGSLAGYFNILNIPYAASGVLVSSIIQNKRITKMMLKDLGINIIEYSSITYSEYKNGEEKALEKFKDLGFPVIVKPVSLGSSVGIKIAENEDELIEAVNYGFKYEDELLVEKKLIKYKEYNQAVLEIEDEYFPSEIEEVINFNPYLTFSDKYLPSKTKKEIPAQITKELKELITRISLSTANYFKTSGVIRIDYLYDETNNVLYLNEINAIPGSLSYYLFETILPFPVLIDNLIKIAIKNHYKNSLKLNSFKSNVLATSRILKK